MILRLVGRPWQPERGASYARLCMGYTVAKVLQHGELRPADFRGNALTDPKTRALADRVRVEADDNPDPNALAPQSVTVRLSSGETLHWGCETMLAHPRRPLSREQHLAKFRACLELAAERQDSGRAGRLIEMVDKLEELPDVREISGQLSGGVWHP